MAIRVLNNGMVLALAFFVPRICFKILYTRKGWHRWIDLSMWRYSYIPMYLLSYLPSSILKSWCRLKYHLHQKCKTAQGSEWLTTLSLWSHTTQFINLLTYQLLHRIFFIYMYIYYNQLHANYECITMAHTRNTNYSRNIPQYEE